MTEFGKICVGSTFKFRGEVWEKINPTVNCLGKQINAMKNEPSDSGRIQDDESACIDEITLVTNL